MQKYIFYKKKIFNKRKKSFNIISIDDKYCRDIFKKSKIKNFIPISITKIVSKSIYFENDLIIDNYFFKNKRISIKNISKSLNGKINLQNILSAYAVSIILKINLKTFLYAIKNFKGLPHRLEKIKENKNFIIINNSKATNIDSAIKVFTKDRISLITG